MQGLQQFFVGHNHACKKQIIMKATGESYMYNRLWNFSIMYKNITKISIKGTTAKSSRLHNVTIFIYYYSQIALYNKTIECGPGTVDVHVAHNV
jgi:hypothetical protein